MGGWVDLVFGFMLKKQQQLPINMVVVVGAAAIIFFLLSLIFFILQIINNKNRQQQGRARWKQDIRSNNKKDLELNHPLCHSTDDKNQSAKSSLLNIIGQEKHTKDVVVVIGSKPSSKTAVTSSESGGNEASNGTQAGNETQSPSPPPHFKVRKEKLGDRITALQQLVSPFGKTDTASVLLETIGYIKFLHEMVHNLSTDDEEAAPKGPKHDLRSRGLCLVPSTYVVTAS